MSEQLKQLAELYLTANEFKPGDLVEWKPGLMNVDVPEYGEPLVVVEVLPIRAQRKDANSQFFNEPRDLRCGRVDPNDGRFEIYAFDPNRMQHYVAK